MIFTFDTYYFPQIFSILCTEIESPGTLWTFAQDVPSSGGEAHKPGCLHAFQAKPLVISQRNSSNFFYSSKITAQGNNGQHFLLKRLYSLSITKALFKL